MNLNDFQCDSGDVKLSHEGRICYTIEQLCELATSELAHQPPKSLDERFFKTSDQCIISRNRLPVLKETLYRGRKFSRKAADRAHTLKATVSSEASKESDGNETNWKQASISKHYNIKRSKFDRNFEKSGESIVLAKDGSNFFLKETNQSVDGKDIASTEMTPPLKRDELDLSIVNDEETEFVTEEEEEEDNDEQIPEWMDDEAIKSTFFNFSQSTEAVEKDHLQYKATWFKEEAGNLATKTSEQGNVLFEGRRRIVIKLAVDIIL
jgi:hypothetical protein